MTRLSHLSIFIMFMIASCSPGAQPTALEPAITLEECSLTSPAGTQTNAHCGRITVPEDRTNPDGRTIELSIAIIPAIKRKPEPDALFLLAGGPGQSAIESFPAMLPMMFNIHQDRDIVLVDQRGTGESHPLRCLDAEDESSSNEEVLAKLESCPATLNADLRYYTTEIAMTDLDQVRAALGYDTINLYGASYGTRAALTYLRMFPERVRTITLDAVVDPGFVMFVDAAQDGQAALNAFFNRCESDESCQQTFPHLRAEFDQLIARMENAAPDISIRHPVTNQLLDLTVTRQMVTNMVFNTLYSPDLVATLPLSIHVAYQDKNYVPLISQALLVDAGLYDGMFYAVTCTEDAPFISAEDAAQQSEGSIFGDRTIEFIKTCAKWPRGQVSEEFRTAFTSDVPALILSGDADPITPPHHAQKVADQLTNDLHLIFSGMGHGNLANHCSANLFKEFITNASVAGLDTSCVEGIQPPPFFVDFSGPRP